MKRTSEIETDILAKIDDLIVQATKERSHFYTASVLKAARQEIVSLRKDLKLERYWKRHDREQNG
jgi:hypothetical protein